VLNLILVVLTFGVFHFTTREFVKAALQILAGYAAVINLLMYFKPETVNVYHEWFQWAGLAAVLPLFAVIGGRISGLRQRLARATRSSARLSAACARSPRTTNSRACPTGIVQRGAPARARQGGASREAGRALLHGPGPFQEHQRHARHQFGDRVLQEAAKRLASCVREGDIIARLGGDEFVLLVEELGDPAALTEIARKLLAAVSDLRKIDGQELTSR